MALYAHLTGRRQLEIRGVGDTCIAENDCLSAKGYPLTCIHPGHSQYGYCQFKVGRWFSLNSELTITRTVATLAAVTTEWTTVSPMEMTNHGNASPVSILHKKLHRQLKSPLARKSLPPHPHLPLPLNRHPLKPHRYFKPYHQLPRHQLQSTSLIQQQSPKREFTLSRPHHRLLRALPLLKPLRMSLVAHSRARWVSCVGRCL